MRRSARQRLEGRRALRYGVVVSPRGRWLAWVQTAVNGALTLPRCVKGGLHLIPYDVQPGSVGAAALALDILDHELCDVERAVSLASRFERSAVPFIVQHGSVGVSAACVRYWVAAAEREVL